MSQANYSVNFTCFLSFVYPNSNLLLYALVFQLIKGILYYPEVSFLL